MKTKTIFLALMLFPALAACKSAYTGTDDDPDTVAVEVTGAEEANPDQSRNQSQENAQDNTQNQGGS